jgi:hypothetical protein
MNRSSLSRTAAFMTVLAMPVLAIPSYVFAQTAPAPAAAAAPAHSVEAHIQALHSQLGITPAEEPQWAIFAQVMRDNAMQMEQAFAARGASLGTMTAVQDMQSYAHIAQVQSANMQKLAASFETLYASFPPAQQKLADGVFRAKMVIHAKP